MAGLPEVAEWPETIYQIEQTDPVLAGPPDLALGQGIDNVPHLMLANRTLHLKAKTDALQEQFAGLTNGAPDDLNTLSELATAVGGDPRFASKVQSQLDELKTPTVTAVSSDNELNAISATTTVKAAQGVLAPPLSVGAIINQFELSDGSAFQNAQRVTTGGVMLTKHSRMRRNGVWSAWTAEGYDIGDLLIQTHQGGAPDRLPANGAARSRTAYADLYARVGNVYGSGDGSTTFNVTDLRGEFLRGLDLGRGVDPGRTIGSRQGHAVGPHRHPKFYSHLGTGAAGTNANYLIDHQGINVGSNLQRDILMSTSSNETRPRNIAVMFCVIF